MYCTLDSLVERIPDHASIALPPDYAGCAMQAIFALMTRRARGLHLIGVPQMGFQADMLIGAGCVARVESAAVTLGEYGLAPRFTAAVTSGAIDIQDATCPALLSGLQAAEKGVPFMPMRGLIGSDLMTARADWKIIDNPFADSDPLVVLPAIRPDVALFHARIADREGNVWVGVRRELMLAAHASRETLVTVEEVRETSLLDDEAMAAGTLPALYVTALAQVSEGARPVGLGGCYEPDRGRLEEYVQAAASEDGFQRWMQHHVLARRAA